MPRPSAKRQSQRQFGAMHRFHHRATLTCHCEALKGPRNDNSGVLTILTAACTDCKCIAGRGMPRPYNGVLPSLFRQNYELFAKR